MNKIGLIILGIVVIGGGVWALTASNQNDDTSSVTANTKITNSTNISNNSIIALPITEVCESDSTTCVHYSDYSEERANDYKDNKRVLFFHAGWCPTCKVANTEFEENIDDIPEDVVVLKTDYDTEKELKEKYGITYQHTFVQIDANGNEVAKWNGGGIDKLKSSIK